MKDVMMSIIPRISRTNFMKNWNHIAAKVTSHCKQELIYQRRDYKRKKLEPLTRCYTIIYLL